MHKLTQDLCVLKRGLKKQLFKAKKYNYIKKYKNFLINLAMKKIENFEKYSRFLFA